jgi:ArsR family transcriptional regulator, lead/cadmium/zinc/bismuth-responsive transcriptional repressor
MSTDLSLSEGLALELAKTFRLLGDANRLRIVTHCLSQPVCVTDIAESLALSQSLVSHHLRLLRMARMVRSERIGQQIFYQVADDHIRCILRDMTTHLNEPSDDDKPAKRKRR